MAKGLQAEQASMHTTASESVLHHVSLNSGFHEDGLQSGTQSQFCATPSAQVLLQPHARSSISAAQSSKVGESPAAASAETSQVNVSGLSWSGTSQQFSVDNFFQATVQVAEKPKKKLKNGPVVIELFAGSGRVTAARKAMNVHSAFGVDHKRLSHIAPIMVADLTTKAGQMLFMTWMETPNLAGIFAAPPCGTCSLARSIKIRDSKGRLLSGPVPLRSRAFPEGFPNLTHTNLKRVLAANKLYEFLAKVALKADERNLIFVIENPRSSLYWITKYFQKIKHLFSFVAHQTQMDGFGRKQVSFPRN